MALWYCLFNLVGVDLVVPPSCVQFLIVDYRGFGFSKARLHCYSVIFQRNEWIFYDKLEEVRRLGDGLSLVIFLGLGIFKEFERSLVQVFLFCPFLLGGLRGVISQLPTFFNF